MVRTAYSVQFFLSPLRSLVELPSRFPVLFPRTVAAGAHWPYCCPCDCPLPSLSLAPGDVLRHDIDIANNVLPGSLHLCYDGLGTNLSDSPTILFHISSFFSVASGTPWLSWLCMDVRWENVGGASIFAFDLELQEVVGDIIWKSIMDLSTSSVDQWILHSHLPVNEAHNVVPAVFTLHIRCCLQLIWLSNNS